MYPPQLQKNFFTPLLFIDQEERKRNRYKTGKKLGANTSGRGPLKNKPFVLKARKNCFAFYSLTERQNRKTIFFLNKELLSATARNP